MQLPRDGQEYAHIVFADLPFNVTVQASVDRETWTDLTVTGTTALYLIRGPLSTATEGDQITGDLAEIWVRVQDSPEHLIRLAGTVIVY